MEFFLTKLVKKVYYRKSEHDHFILHFQNSLGTTYQIKLTFLNFWTKFNQKGYFQSKKEKKIII